MDTCVFIVDSIVSYELWTLTLLVLLIMDTALYVFMECVDWNCVVYERYFRDVLHCFGRGKTRGRRWKNNISEKNTEGENRGKNFDNIDFFFPHCVFSEISGGVVNESIAAHKNATMVNYYKVLLRKKTYGDFLRLPPNDRWYRRFTLLPWWPPLRTWACPYVSLCSSCVRLVTGTSS